MCESVWSVRSEKCVERALDCNSTSFAKRRLAIHYLLYVPLKLAARLINHSED